MSCPKDMIEYAAIFKCRKCKQLIGDMGVHIWLTRTENGYEMSEYDDCERLDRFSNQTKVHKRCFGVCEIIRFEEVK